MRFSRLPLLVFPAFLALVLAFAGCGGGGGTTEATGATEKAESKPTLTKAELIRQGNDICGEVNTAVGSVAASAAETQSQITQTSNLYVGMIEGLQKLGQPAEKEGYAEFMEAAEQLAKVEGEVKLAAEREDTEALGTAASEAAPILEEFQSQAAVYGFADCSEGPHTAEAAPESGGAAPSEEIEESGEFEEELVPEAELEEEVVPEEEIEEVVPEEEIEEVAPETGGAGGEIEEAPPEEVAPEEESESGGVGPG